MKFIKLYLFITTLLFTFVHSDWPDPVANQVKPYRSAGLVQGPMLGRPNDSSMRIWIRTEAAMPFEVRYDTKIPLDASSPKVKGATLAKQDNIGWVDLKNLKANTKYYYGIVLNGKLADTRVRFTDEWTHFKTLPNAKQSVDQDNPEGLFNFAFSLCVGGSQDPKRSGGQYTDPPAWTTLHEKFGDEVMFHIMDGDYTYEEARDGTENGVRANYKLYMNRSRGMSRFQRATPWLFMYDDHEVEDNLFGAGEPGFKKRKSGHINRDKQLKVWQEYAGWANDNAPHKGQLRFGTSQIKKDKSALHDPKADFSNLKLNQISTVLLGTPKSKINERSKLKNAGTYRVLRVIDKHTLELSPKFIADEKVSYSIGTHHYFDKRVSNCHFFFIDTRGERSNFNKGNLKDPKTFLIGETQRKWLVEGIKKSDADFIFIVSSVGIVVPHSAYHVKPEAGDSSKGDGFPGFVHEREIILNELDKINKHIIFFTGDVHASVSAQITDNIHECMVAPFSSNGHPIGTLGNMPYSGFYNAEGRQVKIKWVGSGPNNVHYSRMHQTYFAIVRVNNVFQSAKPDNQGEGYQTIAYKKPNVIVTWYSGYTGKMVYSETISTVDLLPFGEQKTAKK